MQSSLSASALRRISSWRDNETYKVSPEAELAEKLAARLTKNLPKLRNREPGEVILDPVDAAKAVGLRHTADSQPGYHRLGTAPNFRYTDAHDKPLKDEEAMKRIRSLVIPPAWADVWITPHSNGHLQATGRDVRGRKQSRYHPDWRKVRDETKFNRMALFAQALPKIRERVNADLKRPGMPREKVLATIVSLLEATLIRVGNDEYARENHSYGLTTMRTRHVDIHGADVTFEFKGKSGVEHTISLHDKRLARIIHQCEEIPGYELFQFLDHEGHRHALHSDDVNEYLHEITGEHFTAKDFRTWAGSVLAAMLLSQFEPFKSEAQAKKNVVEAIKSVAQKLGNTPAVCRKSYVHPTVLTQYMNAANETTREAIKKQIESQGTSLRAEKEAFLDLLSHQTQV